jgi:hypothetical protein
MVVHSHFFGVFLDLRPLRPKSAMSGMLIAQPPESVPAAAAVTPFAGY